MYCHRFTNDPIQSIRPSPFAEKQAAKVVPDSSRISVNAAELTELSKNATFPRGRMHLWNEELVFVNVFCKEHNEHELVPALNYHNDLQIWYWAGLHPRFSTVQALLSANQKFGEARWVVLRTGEENREWIRNLLEQSHTPEEFLKGIHPRLFTNLYSQGRRFRVWNSFKDKFKARSFTPDDFFAEESQELRRLIIRRGITVKDVLGRMKLIAEDQEGKIYELGDGFRATRYLYVVCPSTGQEYLLGIPRFKSPPRWLGGGTGRMEGEDFANPAEARRWTFRIPADAEFVKEA